MYDVHETCLEREERFLNERDEARSEVERLRAEDAYRRAQMAGQAYTAPDADWDTMFQSLAARVADVVTAKAEARAEVERLRDSYAQGYSDGYIDADNGRSEAIPLLPYSRLGGERDA